MKKLLITIYFDCDDNKAKVNRDFDRFILEVDINKYKEKIFEIFEEKGYTWADFEKINKGYRPIMSIDVMDLTDLEVIRC